MLALLYHTPPRGSGTAAALGRSEAGLHPTRGSPGSRAPTSAGKMKEGSSAQVAERSLRRRSPSVPTTALLPALVPGCRWRAPRRSTPGATPLRRRLWPSGRRARRRRPCCPALLRCRKGRSGLCACSAVPPRRERRSCCSVGRPGATPGSELCRAIAYLKCGLTRGFYVPEMSSSRWVLWRHGEGRKQSGAASGGLEERSRGMRADLMSRCLAIALPLAHMARPSEPVNHQACNTIYQTVWYDLSISTNSPFQRLCSVTRCLPLQDTESALDRGSYFLLHVFVVSNDFSDSSIF